MDVTAASSRDVDGKFFLIFVSFVSCCRTHVLSVTPPLLLTRSCRPVQWQQELKASTGAVDRHRHHHSKPQRRGRKVLLDCCVFFLSCCHTHVLSFTSFPPARQELQAGAAAMDRTLRCRTWHGYQPRYGRRRSYFRGGGSCVPVPCQ